MPDPVVVVPPTMPAKAAPVAPEAPVATPAAPAPPDPKVLQEQFQRLVQREKATLAERQKLAEDKRALDAERSQHAERLKRADEFEKWRDGAKLDPEPFLKPIYGDDWYDKLTEYRLDKRPPPSLEVSALRDELQQFKTQAQKERESAATEAKEREQAEQRAVKERFNQGAVAHVKSAGEKYELINLLGYHDHVPALIEEHWLKQTDVPADQRKVLTVDEAAQMVDDWLAKQWEAMGKAKRLTTPKPPIHTSNGKAPEGISRDVRTLTNGLTPSSATVPVAAQTEAERVKRAYAAFDAAIAKKKNGTA